MRDFRPGDFAATPTGLTGIVVSVGLDTIEIVPLLETAETDSAHGSGRIRVSREELRHVPLRDAHRQKPATVSKPDTQDVRQTGVIGGLSGWRLVSAFVKIGIASVVVLVVLLILLVAVIPTRPPDSGTQLSTNTRATQPEVAVKAATSPAARQSVDPVGLPAAPVQRDHSEIKYGPVQPDPEIKYGPNGAIARCRNGKYVMVDLGPKTCNGNSGVAERYPERPPGFPRRSPSAAELAASAREATERAREAALAGVTMRNYLRLRTGMTWGDVNDILGGDGKELARTGGLATYQWSAGWRGGNVTATFEGEKLVSKAQFGLR